MENIMNKDMKLFIEKLQKTGRELYEEYNSLDDSGIEYTCPLTILIDELYSFSIMNIDETIDESIYEIINR